MSMAYISALCQSQPSHSECETRSVKIIFFNHDRGLRDMPPSYSMLYEYAVRMTTFNSQLTLL